MHRPGHPPWADVEQFYDDSDVREMVADAGCGLVLASITNIQFQKPNTATPDALVRNAALAGDTGVRLLLEQLARDSGRPELRAAPLLFWGFSAAASFSTTFAALHPERTIGFVRYHTHRRGLSQDVESLRGIPALLVAGANDTAAGIEDAREMWQQGRAVAAPWTFAVEPGADSASWKRV